jgi:hypothetical protein
VETRRLWVDDRGPPHLTALAAACRLAVRRGGVTLATALWRPNSPGLSSRRRSSPSHTGGGRSEDAGAAGASAACTGFIAA